MAKGLRGWSFRRYYRSLRTYVFLTAQFYAANKNDTMEDEAVLLKIKRDFTNSEAVQSLLKIVSALEIEVGMLKSELAEAKSIANKIRKERTQTKKQWLQDEVMVEIAKELTKHKDRSTELNKQANEWRNKYFSLLAKYEPLQRPLTH